MKNLVIQRLTDFERENFMATETKELINVMVKMSTERLGKRWTDTIKMGLKNVRFLRITGL